MNSPEDKGFKTFIIAILRRASRFWKPKNECLKAARIHRGLYKCALCTKIVGPKQIQVDHIDPVIPLEGCDSWDIIIPRMFCTVDKLQAICKDCHTIKTNDEKAKRKVLRKERAVLRSGKRKKRG